MYVGGRQPTWLFCRRDHWGSELPSNFQKSIPLASTVLVGIFALFGGLAAASGATPAPKMLIMTFPNVPVATLQVWRVKTDPKGQPVRTCNKVLARGKVLIPADAQIGIDLKFDGLEHLQSLAQLQPLAVTQLACSGLDLDDKGLAFFTRFPALFRFNLDSTEITDKSVPVLASFKGLRDARLCKIDITGDNFDCLNGRPIHDLNLEGTNLKAGNLAKIKSLPGTIANLNVSKTRIDSRDMAFIGTMHELYSLDLSYIKAVNDTNIKEIFKLKNLQYLNLLDTSVTETSLPSLLKLPKLQKLVVRHSKFWKIGHGKSPRAGLVIQDGAEASRTPADLFDPLHPNF